MNTNEFLEDLRHLAEPVEIKAEVNLLKCPFCGNNKPRLVKYFKDEILRFSDKYAVQCKYTGTKKGCGSEGQQNKVMELAIQAWNKRAKM